MLDDYRDRYPNISITREDGLLEVRLHTDGGPLAWSAAAHRDLGILFGQIGADRENRVVLLSGTGNVFCDTIDHETFADLRWEQIWSEGKRLLQSLVDIEVPVVGVVNGPATIHAELVAISDIVVAADHAVLADKAHFINGAVPSDGVHLIWPHLLGPNRGRHFLLDGQGARRPRGLRSGRGGRGRPGGGRLRPWARHRPLARRPLEPRVALHAGGVRRRVARAAPRQLPEQWARARGARHRPAPLNGRARGVRTTARGHVVVQVIVVYPTTTRARPRFMMRPCGLSACSRRCDVTRSAGK